jgi:hypothetical protein
MLQLSEKWVRCESIRGRDKNINLRVGSMGPTFTNNVKVGQPPNNYQRRLDELDALQSRGE